MKSLLCTIVIACMLVGCAHKPTFQEKANAYYGPYPTDYREIVTGYVTRDLYDPYSAALSSWRGPSRGWTMDWGTTMYGYRVCVVLNAKNLYGAYAGAEQHLLIVRDGQVVFSTIGKTTAHDAPSVCAGIPYGH